MLKGGTKLTLTLKPCLREVRIGKRAKKKLGLGGGGGEVEKQIK